MLRVLQFSVIWSADVVSFGVQDVSLGMPDASTLAPWEHKKGVVGEAWISIDFERISGPHFESLLVTLEPHMCFFSCLFPDHVVNDLRV